VHLHPNESAPEAMERSREARGRALLAASALLAALALTALIDGHGVIFFVAAGTASACVSSAQRRFRRAGEARIGAASERRVIEVLDMLEGEGWRFFHSVVWPENGDIDSVGVGPGPAGRRLIVAIETKTTAFNRFHVRRTLRAARFVARRRPYAAVLVTIRQRETTVQDGVTVCDVDRLVGALRALAREHAERSSMRPARRTR
jgi:hypothetical protein